MSTKEFRWSFFLIILIQSVLAPLFLFFDRSQGISCKQTATLASICPSWLHHSVLTTLWCPWNTKRRRATLLATSKPTHMCVARHRVAGSRMLTPDIQAATRDISCTHVPLVLLRSKMIITIIVLKTLKLTIQRFQISLLLQSTARPLLSHAIQLDFGHLSSNCYQHPAKIVAPRSLSPLFVPNHYRHLLFH